MSLHFKEISISERISVRISPNAVPVDLYQTASKTQSAMDALIFTVCWLVDSWRKKNNSCRTSENKKEVPISILEILEKGKLFLMGAHTMETTQDATQSALTTRILESAYVHQQKASTSRLGTGLPKTTHTTGSQLGLNQFKNLSKAKAIQDERKAKKAEVQLKEVGIRVVATIWKSDNVKNKLTQVSMPVIVKVIVSLTMEI
jgi:hypothetical protein